MRRQTALRVLPSHCHTIYKRKMQCVIFPPPPLRPRMGVHRGRCSRKHHSPSSYACVCNTNIHPSCAHILHRCNVFSILPQKLKDNCIFSSPPTPSSFARSLKTASEWSGSFIVNVVQASLVTYRNMSQEPWVVNQKFEMRDLYKRGRLASVGLSQSRRDKIESRAFRNQHVRLWAHDPACFCMQKAPVRNDEMSEGRVRSPGV